MKVEDIEKIVRLAVDDTKLSGKQINNDFIEWQIYMLKNLFEFKEDEEKLRAMFKDDIMLPPRMIKTSYDSKHWEIENAAMMR